LSTTAKGEIHRFIIERNLDLHALDFNHIFFLSAHEFERLLYVVKHEKTEMSAILTRVAEANAAEKKLQFGQHLRHLYKTTAPDFVTLPYRTMTAGVEHKVSSSVGETTE
jgi:hypothetical protein